MTVAELRALIADVPDGLQVVVRASDDDADQWITGDVLHVGVEHAHDEDGTAFLAIDAGAAFRFDDDVADPADATH